jgi:hypothetical protein
MFVFCAGDVHASIRSDREDAVKRLPNEYRPVAEDCLSKGGFDCCMSAVRTMVSGDFPQANLKDGDYICPQGYVEKTRQCVESYHWCEPQKQKVSK